MEKDKTKLFEIHSLRFRNDIHKLDQSSQNIYLNPIHPVPIEFFDVEIYIFVQLFLPKRCAFYVKKHQLEQEILPSKEI